MTTFQLKLIALTSMIIDHVGIFFFPHVLWMRIVGRLAMPIYAWLIANGAHHTRNMYSYMRRLLLFAVISQIPFLLANLQRDPAFDYMNILFSFSVGLGAIMLLKKTHQPLIRGLILLSALALTYLIKLDYGPTALFMVIISFVFYHDLTKLILFQSLLIISSYTIPILAQLSADPGMSVDAVRLFQPVCLLSFAAIAMYNKKEGVKTGYLMYIIYPLHFLVIYLIKLL